MWKKLELIQMERFEYVEKVFSTYSLHDVRCTTKKVYKKREAQTRTSLYLYYI